MDETATITADYALQMAERIEWNGQQFYTLAARAMDHPNTRQLLLWLADREAEHQKTFAALREGLTHNDSAAPPAEVDAETSAAIRALSAGKFFDAAVKPEQHLAPNDTPRDIILTAIGFEKDSIVFYQALKGLSVLPLADGEVAQTLERIIREELSHLARLAASLD